MTAQSYAESRCEHCHRAYPLNGARYCVPCLNLISDASPDGEKETERKEIETATATKPPLSLVAFPSHQDEDEDQDQDEDEGTSSLKAHGPGPGGNQEMTGLDVLRILEDRCRTGTRTPAHVELGEIPPGAGHVMREIAYDIQWLISVRLAAGLPLEIPYAASMAVNRGLARDKSTASRALAQLVALGVIRHVGELKRMPGLPNGTKLYAPPETPESTDTRGIG